MVIFLFAETRLFFFNIRFTALIRLTPHQCSFPPFTYSTSDYELRFLEFNNACFFNTLQLERA